MALYSGQPTSAPARSGTRAGGAQTSFREQLYRFQGREVSDAALHGIESTVAWHDSRGLRHDGSAYRDLIMVPYLDSGSLLARITVGSEGALHKFEYDVHDRSGMLHIEERQIERN